MAELGKADGWVNLARVYQREGRIPDALAALEKAADHKEPAAPWVINWLTGQINDRNGHLDEAIASYESVLATKIPARGFDFSLDYEVINALGTVALQPCPAASPCTAPPRREFLRKTIDAYRRTLAIDSENVAAHYGLGLAYSDLKSGEGGSEPAAVDPKAKRSTTAVDADMIAALGKRAADTKARPEDLHKRSPKAPGRSTEKTTK